MPITIACTCGKIYEAPDRAAGRTITCHMCQAVLTVPVPQAGGPPPLPSGAPAPPPPLPPDAPAPLPPPRPGKMRCLFCDAEVNERFLRCPLCGGSIREDVTRERKLQLLDDMLQKLDAHVADPVAIEKDRRFRGGLLTLKSKILLVITLVCILMIILGSDSQGGSDEAVAVCGIIFGIIFGISFLLSLGNDYIAKRAQHMKKPHKALKYFFLALKRGRARKVFTALAPTARKVGTVDAIGFDIIPESVGTFAINNQKSFERYWKKSVLRSSGGQRRTFLLRKMWTIKQTKDGLAIIEVIFQFINYPFSPILAFLMWPLLILFFALQKSEMKKIRKLLVRRDDKWFFAESEFEGILDTLRL